MPPAFSQYVLQKELELYTTFGSTSLAMLRLFVNDITPDYATDVGDFEECELDGYAPVDVTAGPWTPSFVAGLASRQYPMTTFTFDPYAGPAVTIFGWYFTNYGSPPTLWMHAARLATPYEVSLGGDSLALLPRIFGRLCVE